MSKLIRVSLTLVIAASAVGAASAETTASRVFAISSPSVVVVKAIDSSGKIVAQGSGVTIAKGIIVSNCHVFEDESTATASVFYRSRRYPATLRYADVEHDLCSFTVTNLLAPPIQMRDAVNLKVGEDAYAIGAPEGFDLTLSSGIISSLRTTTKGTVIQTTAPISPGSSGGGLFDSKGHLIGITSYYAKEGQQINFALPVEWIKALPRNGKTLKQLADEPPATRGDLREGTKAYLNGDYASALSVFEPLAQGGDQGAQVMLGAIYSGGEGAPRDYTKAAQWYLAAARQGNTIAEGELGMMYVLGQGTPQDYDRAAYWLRKASKGGYARAQFGLGLLYGSGLGVPIDYVRSATWLILAQASNVETADKYLRMIERNMTHAQIAEARTLAREWWTAHHKQ